MKRTRVADPSGSLWKMNLLFVLLSLAFIAPAAKGHCCYPTKFEAEGLSFNRRNPGRFNVSVDFDLQKSIQFSFDENSDVVYVLKDAANHIGYTQYRDGSCVKYMNKEDLLQCIPENATLHNNTMFYNVSAWEFKMNGFNIQRVVSKDGKCRSVVTSHRTPDGTDFDISFYFNPTTHIDEKVFDKDVSNCKFIDSMER